MSNPSFYLYDDNKSSEEVQNITINKRRNRDISIYDRSIRKESTNFYNINSSSLSNSSLTNDISRDPVKDTHLNPRVDSNARDFSKDFRINSPIMTLKDQFNNLSDILKFPIESSHSYSYAHLSPNSLALRLNVLKRSLEILKERPNLYNSMKDANEPLTKKKLDNKNFNASSAALSALFKPSMKRSDSFPTQEIYSNKESSNNLSNDLKEILKLLESNDVNIPNSKDFATTLHDLSLSSDNGLNSVKRLMAALSTPFVDTSVMTTTDSLPMRPSSIALNLLNTANTPLGNPNSPVGSRPFHSISSGKHSLPQSVFTIDIENPWQVKAANDLACLMFGVSKNMIRSLTLMDLIAPQFREFVIERLTKFLSNELQVNLKTDIIFSGEIVAITRPSDKNYSWTSLWAKRKGKLIIFMFDQIPCDAFDIVISKNLTSSEDETKQDFTVKSINEVAGNLFNKLPQNLINLTEISTSIDQFLESIENTNESESLNYIQSELINERRYFTLQINDENVPCAVTSNALDINPSKLELKLKIHSLPYIAGIFVIDGANFNILSCNNSIAKNLFGQSSINLVGKSINLLIENFEDIFNSGLKDIESQFSIVPGLVLPEHFFRRYKNSLKSDGSTEDFLNSKGLVANHLDGNKFFVDVQLRVSTPSTYVLWITYSRSLNSVVDNESNRPIFKRSRSVSGDSINQNLNTNFDSLAKSKTPGFARLPSQLKLFETSNLATVGEISRNNSTRTPNLKDIRASSGNRDSIFESFEGDSHSDIPTISTTGTSVNEEISEFVQVNFSDLVVQEDNQIMEKAKKSRNWPSKIGQKRRTKKITEFDIVKEIGEGAYGKVIIGQHKNDKPYEVIIKCIDKERILVDTWVRDRNLGTIPSEIQIMSTLMKELHPNIMRIIDFFEDEQYYYLETPIFGSPPAIDLFDYIEVKEDMTEFECRFIFKQIVSAIFHLHKHGIVHRDIKDENIIVDERGIIKLIDFGSAGYTKSGPFDVFVGTIDYASPEVLKGEKYDGKPQDVWALGILLYTILYKENPFYNVDEIMEGDLRLPPVISNEPINLIKKILVRDIASRPTITDIVEDPWLNY
ncbi:serine/threonine-protein kinase Psk2p [[Candida] jaroonii]|uniref:Serine/threonine-protein kinase Psk2p n=1 Tax=[Candida] jaroonii TaxID=467808 RepID=A0ACA9Y2A5_9ASCO|nr:serine/threonine-protein kinase Psk2p [[Candida] jaroonii]